MQWGLGRRASRTGRGDALVGQTRAAPALQARPSTAAPLIAATLLSVDRVFKTDGLRRALCAAAIHPFGASTVAWPIIFPFRRAGLAPPRHNDFRYCARS